MKTMPNIENEIKILDAKIKSLSRWIGDIEIKNFQLKESLLALADCLGLQVCIVENTNGCREVKIIKKDA